MNNIDDLETTRIIPLDSPLYPNSLKNIKNPPKVLYARGNLSLLDNPPGVCIVGTRDATQKGLVITQRVTEYIVSQGSIVISGLALGIDAQAHESCLAAGGKTIAVLAHGLHMAQPRQNAELAQRILESGGLWVSEHPDGTTANKRFYVPRNRIQVGLSSCSIIIEANEVSGTTTHAQFCVKENRALYAVIPTKGNPLKLNSTGPQMMADTMGATPLSSREDYEKINITKDSKK